MSTTPSRNASNLFALYGLVSAAYLACLLFVPVAITFWIKMLLLPILIAAVWNAGAFPHKSWLLAALLFSWAGDVVIAFAYLGERFFILGLVAFLIAHVCYILLFQQATGRRPKTKPYLWWVGVLQLLYLAGFLGQLFPYLHALQMPVTIYALVISIMLGMAVRGWSHWPAHSAQWIIAGAAFFVASDSILAWNKFYAPLPLAQVWIMGTYLLAQYLLARGVRDLHPEP